MHLGKIAAVGAALFAFLAFASPSLAVEVEATTNVNVRGTPGGAIVDVMQRGERAEVVRRSGSWCGVERRRGSDGWVACQYLDEGYSRPITGGGGSGSSQPNVSIEFSIPGFSISVGGGDFDRPGRPGRPDRPGRPGVDQVCFYEHVNYRGASFCARPGERLRALGSWNNRISSIRVRGDAEAQVCDRNDFRGRCIMVDRDIRNLGPRGNDSISSIRVR